jgi:hypothetical protein
VRVLVVLVYVMSKVEVEVRSVGHVGSSKAMSSLKARACFQAFRQTPEARAITHTPSVLHVILYFPPAHHISKIAIHHHAYGKDNRSDNDPHKADLETCKSSRLTATSRPEDDSGSARSRSRSRTWCEPVVVS